MPFYQAVIDDYGLDDDGNPIAAGSIIHTPFDMRSGVRMLFFVSRATREPTVVTPFTQDVEYRLGNATEITDCVRGYTEDGFIIGGNANAFAGNHSVLIWQDTSPDSRYLRIGTYVGNGGSAAIDVGFIPTHVLIVGGASWAWKSPEMPATHSVFFANQTAAPVTNGINGFTLAPKGFTVGNSVNVNGAGVTYVWIAVKATAAFASFFRSFHILGTGVAGQPVSGFSFAPGFVVSKEQQAGGSGAFMRIPRHSGLESLSVFGLTVVTNGIDGVSANALTIGADAASSGVDVYGFATPAVPKAGGGVSVNVITEDTGCVLDFPTGVAAADTACAAATFLGE